MKDEMKHKIKAVFFDVDQTLLSHRDRQIPSGAAGSILALQKKGIKVIISTGRHMLELDVLDHAGIRFDGYNIMNGQMCLDADRKPFYEAPITGPDRDALIRLYEERTVPVVLVGRDQLYINYIDERVRTVMKRVPAQMPVEEPFGDDTLFMGGIFCDREQDDYYSSLFEGLTLTRWNRLAADIIPSDAGKVRGMQVFLDRYGLDREEIMAFGDEENDVEMLSFAGIGVAMGNAQESVKNAADYVTADIDQDGVRQAFIHFGLLQE